MEWHARSIKSRLGTVVRERNPLALVATVSVKEVKENPPRTRGGFFWFRKDCGKKRRKGRGCGVVYARNVSVKEVFFGLGKIVEKNGEKERGCGVAYARNVSVKEFFWFRKECGKNGEKGAAVE